MNGGDAYESEHYKHERRRLLSALETIDLMIKFGMFTIALIGLVVTLLKNDKKK